MLDGNQLSKKLIGSDDERAVSPVIGVILMVAITVILAAVIAAFVLDLGGSVGEDPQAGVDIDDSNSSEVSVSVTSMGNSDGVAVVNGSGEVVEQKGTDDDYAYMNSTGSSVTVNATHRDAGSVVAYIGDTDTVVAGDEDGLDDAESTATVGSIDS